MNRALLSAAGIAVISSLLWIPAGGAQLTHGEQVTPQTQAVQQAQATQQAELIPGVQNSQGTQARPFDPSADHSIVNGRVAPYSQMPSFIQMVIKDRNGKFNHNCGGTLLDREWVLSAAHCFWNYNHFLETSEAVPLPLGSFYAIHPERHEERLIDRVIFPDEIQSLGWGADIALVHVSQPFTSNDRVTIPEPNMPKPYGGLGTVWGKGNAFKVGPDRYTFDSHDVYESKMRRAEVTLNRPEFCGDPSRVPNLLCAETPSTNGGSPASCTGDSGGPLTIFSDDLNRQIQIGIVSHANAPSGVDVCGGQPTWYSNVSQWTPWIKRHVPTVKTASYALNPADGAPRQTPVTPPSPPNALQCGSVSETGGAVPTADSPSLSFQPPRGEAVGSAVSVTASRLAWPTGTSPQAVVLAGECAWADALAATSMAASAPLLLTASQSLEADVAAEINRLGVTQVYILGGSNAVAPQVEQAVAAAGKTVTRIAGDSRVGTAAALAKLNAPRTKPTQAVLARAYAAPGGTPSQAFADSLSAAAFAPTHNAPVLLSATDSLSEDTQQALTMIKPRKVHLLGGPGALSSGLEPVIRQRGGNPELVRHAGSSRAETAAAVARLMLTDGHRRAKGVLVIDGYADDAWKVGFSFAGLAAKTNSVYALASGATLPPETVALIREAKANQLPIRCVANAQACAAAAKI